MGKASAYEAEDSWFEPRHGFTVGSETLPMPCFFVFSSYFLVWFGFGVFFVPVALPMVVESEASPCGPMDKASAYEAEDSGFEPRHGFIYGSKASDVLFFSKILFFFFGVVLV